MITLNDYENLLKYFEEKGVPEELENFVAKLKIMHEEIIYKKEVQEHLKELDSKLKELSKNDEEEK